METFLRIRLRRVALTIVSLVSLFFAPAALAEEDEPIERVSEAILTPGEAWEEPGFRIQLRLGSESVEASDRISGGSGLVISAEPGVRLSRWWSVSADLTYTVLSGELNGLRWSGTADLTFHPWAGLFLSAGAGYAGLMADAFVAHESFVSCTGSGAAASLRAGWLFPVGDLFATGPMIESRWQWTQCGRGGDGGSGTMVDEQPEEWPDRSLTVPEPPSVWRLRTLHFAWSLAWR